MASLASNSYAKVDELIRLRGMSCYSVAEEIMPGRADYLVELKGFKP